jgi:hypothetical protein
MTVTTSTPPAATLTAAELAAYLALVQAQAAARQQLTQAAVDAVIALIEQFGDWWDSDAITVLTRQILRQVQPAQRRAARLTDSYVARVVSKQRGRAARPAGAVDVTKLRRKLPQELIEKLARDEVDVPVVELGDTFDGPGDDIDAELEDLLSLVDTPPEWREPADAYGRIADQYRWDIISKGKTEDEALEHAKVRAEQVVDTDIALAVRAQEVKTAKKLGVKLYRRVLHPELAESGLSCGLCIVAADRVYSVGKFARELHLHCHCEMIPIDGDNDPGLQLNADDLESLYQAAGRAVGKDEGERETGGGAKQLGALKRVRVAVTEHGELGPILVKVGTTSDGKLRTEGVDTARVGKNRTGELGFRSVKDFAKTQSTSPKIRAEQQLPAMIESLARLEARKASGDDTAVKPIAFHRRRIAELRRIAGG